MISRVAESEKIFKTLSEKVCELAWNRPCIFQGCASKVNDVKAYYGRRDMSFSLDLDYGLQNSFVLLETSVSKMEIYK